MLNKDEHNHSPEEVQELVLSLCTQFQEKGLCPTLVTAALLEMVAVSFTFYSTETVAKLFALLVESTAAHKRAYAAMQTKDFISALQEKAKSEPKNG